MLKSVYSLPFPPRSRTYFSKISRCQESGKLAAAAPPLLRQRHYHLSKHCENESSSSSSSDRPRVVTSEQQRTLRHGEQTRRLLNLFWAKFRSASPSPRSQNLAPCFLVGDCTPLLSLKTDPGCCCWCHFFWLSESYRYSESPAAAAAMEQQGKAALLCASSTTKNWQGNWGRTWRNILGRRKKRRGFLQGENPRENWRIRVTRHNNGEGRKEDA